jgi:hypothetical protein
MLLFLSWCTKHLRYPHADAVLLRLTFFLRSSDSISSVAPKMQMPAFLNPLSTSTKARSVGAGEVDKNGLRPGDKVGIMFLNLGGPEKLDEVEDFLFNLFNDEDIIRLPNALKPLQGKSTPVSRQGR